MPRKKKGNIKDLVIPPPRVKKLPKPEPLPWRKEDVAPVVAEQAREILAAIEARRAEALSLYESLDSQTEFHKSTAKIRLIRGSNRAGKTLGTCVEVARAVCGRDPFNKWPKENGRFYILGKAQKEIGEVLYPKLFKAGAFKMIRDSVTHRWRAWRPWDIQDRQLKHLTKPAPPLIPPTMIESISWESKKDSVPSKVTLRNGWEMVFMASGGKPIQGPDIDGVLFDEEILDREWFPEMMARLLDRNGKFIWSATPQAGTEHLYAIHQRATEREPGVEEFFITLAGNPFIDEAEKISFAMNFSDDEYNVRILGNYAMSGYTVYPEWSQHAHCIEPFDIPLEWSRYMVVDPGRQVCAVLFAAIPPENQHCYLYDELYLKRTNAFEFADAVARRVEGFSFEAFIIDHQGGQITDIGSGRQVEQQYSEELRKLRVSCQRTGSGFIWGSTDVKGGMEVTRSWLRIRRDGSPYLQVFGNRCPNFLWEMKYYHFKRGADGVLTDDPVRKNDHACACFRYLAAFQPTYVEPPPPAPRESDVLRVLRQKRKMQNKDRPKYIALGPGA